MRGIDKRFGPVQANRAVDLTLRHREILGLLGENGAGKTTLMNILFGIYARGRRRDRGSTGGRCASAAPPTRWPPASAWCTSTSTWSPRHTVLENLMVGRAGPRRAARSRPAARRAARRDRPRFGLRLDPDRAGRRPHDRRAAAPGDRQGARPRRPHPDPRRADRGADAAGDRGPVRGAPGHGGAAAWASSSSATSWTRSCAITNRIVVMRQGARGRRAGQRRQPSQRAELAELMCGHELDAAGAARRRAPGRVAACPRPGRAPTAGASSRRSEGRLAERPRRRDPRHRRRLRQRPARARRRHRRHAQAARRRDRGRRARPSPRARARGDAGASASAACPRTASAPA